MTKKAVKNNLKNFSATKFISLVAVFSFFLIFGFCLRILFSDVKNSEASEASAGSSVYYASISNDDTVTIPVTPTADQEEYTKTSNITFSNTCTAGSYVYISTNSSNNDLTRTGSDDGIKTIDAVTGSGLTENTWGFKIDGSGSAFTQVPVSSSPVVLYSSTKAETDTTIPVVYGVKVDNNLPAGTYLNDVLYTLVVDNKCLTYTLSFDLDGGTGASGVDYSDQSINYGDKINLSTYTPTKSGYTFAGWTNGSSSFTGSETSVDVNPDGNFALKLTAKWKLDPIIPSSACSGSYGASQTVNLGVNGSQSFDYSGKIICAILSKDGYYKIEAWGAQGGSTAHYSSTSYTRSGGYGGYSAGVIRTQQNASIYVTVGMMGGTVAIGSTDNNNGYNGGGYSGTSGSYGCNAGGGGGATHFATKTGLLSGLSSNKDAILMVAAGGGGAAVNWSADGTWEGNGGNGGGYIGNSGQCGTNNSCHYYGTGGSQTTVGTMQPVHPTDTYPLQMANASFGFGQNRTTRIDSEAEGGGGGYYGGGAGLFAGGGGGSGYINSSYLFSKNNITKHMTCYSCSTSTADATRTNSNTTTPSATATADVAKLGNGFARITYLGASI